MRSLIFKTIVTLAALGGVSGPGFSQLKKPQEADMVPAAMGIRTDSKGNTWNLESNGTLGRVGSSMINSGVSLLVNDEQFYTYQPMMTKDGSEFLLRGRPLPSLPGLEVTRHITFFDQEGAIRYVERFTNTTSNEARLTISLRSNFSGNFRSYLTDEGRTGVDMLGESESAILVTPGSTQSSRAFLYTLTSSQSDLKPTIASQNRYGLTFQYSVVIPPGQTRALGHVVAQVLVPEKFDRKSLAKVFRTYSLDSMMASVSPDVQQELVNYQVGKPLDGALMFQSTGVDSLEVKRGRRDVLASGEETRLVGSAKCGELSFKNQFGEVVIPFEKVVAIEGLNGGRRDSVRVFLKDGQIFAGECVASEFEFLLASGGRVPLDFESLDRLVMAVDVANEPSRGTAAGLIETYEGDRIAVELLDTVMLQGRTPWGILDFSLNDIEWLSPLDDEPVGQFVSFKDGTRCFAFLTGDTLQIDSNLFGKVELPVSMVRAIMVQSGGKTEPTEEPMVARPEIKIGDNQRIIGSILNSTLTVLSDSQAIEVSPNEVRELTRTNRAGKEAAPVFKIELWGGGKVIGKLKDPTVSMQVRGKEWKLPVTDIQSLTTPTPPLDEVKQTEISELIKSLGADDWAAREAASTSLMEFGSAGKSVLEKALKTSSDPEVRRRIGLILQRIQ